MTFFSGLPRYRLAFLPTPIHPLPRLSADISPSGAIQIWMKRDDQTGLAGGGNKTRKLEMLVADALDKGADTLITTGAAQSNHCRQTAAAAAAAGLACHVVLSGQPPDVPTGNLLLDRLLGAEIHWTERSQRLERLHSLEVELRAGGRRPYFITYGGSDAVGASAYALAIDELLNQVRSLDVQLDAIVFASSSGGTHAGLAAGARLLDWDVPVLGVSIDEQAADLQRNVAALATGVAARLGSPVEFSAEDILVNADYLGAGYGVVGDLERSAIALTARTEGVLLDPVYTGRAFGGLLDMLRRDPRRFRRERNAEANILFWHTGGSPALFAYAADLA